MQGHLGRVGEERCTHIRAPVIVKQALMSRQHLEDLLSCASRLSSSEVLNSCTQGERSAARTSGC